MLEALRESAGLWRLPLTTPTLPPATMTNHYLVGDLEAVLVDPAAPARVDQNRLAALLEEAQRAGIVVQALFLTSILFLTGKRW